LEKHKLRELVLSRLSKLKEYKFGELIEDMERQQTALAESRQHGRPGGNRGVHTKTNAKFAKATTYVRDGLLGKALQELTKADAAACTEQNFHALKALHPEGEAVHPLKWDSANFEAKQREHQGPDVREVTVGEVVKAITGIKRRTAPGLSRWKGEHLQLAIKYGGDADRLKKALAAAVTITLEAKIPTSVLDLTRNAKLIGISKPNSPTAVRPIALAETLAKVAEKVVVHKLRVLASDFAKEGQYGGAGVKGGTEAVPQILRAALSKAKERGGREGHGRAGNGSHRHPERVQHDGEEIYR
jgi:hypothetical protein